MRRNTRKKSHLQNPHRLSFDINLKRIPNPPKRRSGIGSPEPCWQLRYLIRSQVEVDLLYSKLFSRRPCRHARQRIKYDRDLRGLRSRKPFLVSDKKREVFCASFQFLFRDVSMTLQSGSARCDFSLLLVSCSRDALGWFEIID
jgi:hypothetical protein